MRAAWLSLLLTGCIHYEPTLCAPCVGGCGDGLRCVDGRCRSPEVPCDAAPGDAARPDVFAPDAAPADAAPLACAEGERPVGGACVGPGQVDVGTDSACAIWADGRASCWGLNHHHRLGVDTVRLARRPVLVPGISDATEIGVGNDHACVRGPSGVRCWGRDGSHDHGPGPGLPVPLPEGFDPVELAVGPVSTCVRAADGRVTCFGADAEGQLGRGFVDERPAPRFERIDLGWGHACGLHDGLLTCWGGESHGEKGGAGDGPQTMQTDGRQVADFALGHDSTCMLFADGAVRCLGRTPVEDAGPFVEVRANGAQACARGADQTVTCFGVTDLRVGAEARSPARPAAVDERLSVGERAACLHAPGQVAECWGTSGRGLLTEPWLEAGQWSDPGPFARVAVGHRHTCARTPTGVVECWGFGGDGRLGHPAPSRSAAPRPVADLAASVVATSERFTCAVGEDRRLYCFGENRDGRAGPGAGSPLTDATPVVGLEDVVGVALGLEFTCALTADQTVHCFGANDRAQLGHAEPPGPVSVVEVPPMRQLAAGLRFACGLSVAGEVWCWGDNAEGQVDARRLGGALPPTQVEGLDRVDAISAGDYYACALRAGSILCWGRNLNGELGRGDRSATGVPAPVPGIDAASALSIGASHGCAVSEGHLDCWGFEAAERLGPGRFDGRGPLPRPGVGATRIAGITDAVDVSVGCDVSCVVGETGALTCLGMDYFGHASRREHDPTALFPIRSPH